MIELQVNGRGLRCEAGPTIPLLDLIRSLGLTGTKEGCGVGRCGLCTVLVDDRAVSSCLTLAGCVDGAEVWTIEGLQDRFPGVVEAFVRNEGMQCGICTPGQIVATCALLIESSAGVRHDPREATNGNLCRCSGYSSILASIEDALGPR